LNQNDSNKPVKPIFINENIQVVRNVLTNLQFMTRPVYKVRSAKSTQVSCFSLQDKKMLINKLQSQQIPFHSFTDPSEKSRCFVLKGFYSTHREDLMTILSSNNVPALKVTDFIRKEDFVMYIVHFDSSINVNFLSHNHRIIDGIAVKWEPLKKTENRITQCYNCQRWGHSSINCGYPTRCVKCVAAHAKGSCSRTNREGEPECCNCGGSHAANHRGCPIFIKHCDRLKSRPRKISPVPANFNSPRVDNTNQFPVLSQTSSLPGNIVSNRVSFSQKVKESHNNSMFLKLSQAQEKLRAVPMINETIERFVQMVDEISSCSDPSDHFNILMKYSFPNYSFDNGN
jgi:hypothetical protein